MQIPKLKRAWIEPAGRRYRVRWIDQDGKKRSRGPFALKREAETWRDAIQRELNSWATGGPARLLSQAILDYSTTRLSRATPKHQVETAGVLHRFTMAVGDRVLGTIGSPQIAGFIDGLKHLRSKREEVKLSNARRRGVWLVLNAFYRHCMRERWIERNPMDSVPKPPLDQKVVRVPTDEQLVRLLEAVGSAAIPDRQGWHLLIVMAYVMGLRQRDLGAIRIADIDFGEGEEPAVVKFELSKQRRRSERLKGIPGWLAADVAKRVTDLADGAQRLLGGVWHYPTWKKLKAAAPFDWTFHDLRRASGTQAAEARAQAAGAHALDHSAPRVFAQHYQEASRVQRAIARQIRKPEGLPPMPPRDALPV